MTAACAARFGRRGGHNGPGALLQRPWPPPKGADTWRRNTRRRSTRESVPFRVRTADGETVDLTYSSPRAGGNARRARGPRVAALVRERQADAELDAARDGLLRRGRADLGRRWGAEGIGTLREVLVSRPTVNETRDEYAREWQYYYSSRAGNADLGRLQAQFDEYYQVLADNGVRVNYIEAPVPALGAYGYLKNLVTLAGGGLVVHGGAIIHRMGLGSWQRGREVIWSKVLAALQVPIYLTIHGTASASRAQAAGSTRRRSSSTSRWSRTRRGCARSSSC